MLPRIGPSILNADLSNLAKECETFVTAGCDYLHLDVMDGHFVPNITFGASTVKCLRKAIPKVDFEAHMNVTEPEKWIGDMADAGVSLYTFHFEACSEVERVARKVREAGMRCGLSIKPMTDVDAIIRFLDSDLIDEVLVMTVEPGFGGQKFITASMEKVRQLRTLHPTLNIGVDGGVGLSNVHVCAEAGANMIVSGSALINAPNKAEMIASLRDSVSKAIQQRADAAASHAHTN